jgi:hypothetical protein
MSTRTPARRKTLSVTGYTISDGNSGRQHTTVTLQDNASGVITPAQLIYTAAAVSREQDKDNPLLSGSISGIVSGDSLAAITSGNVIWLTNATKSSPADATPTPAAALSLSTATTWPTSSMRPATPWR